MGRVAKAMLATGGHTSVDRPSLKNSTSESGSTAEELLRRLNEIRRRGRAEPVPAAVPATAAEPPATGRTYPVHPAAVLAGLAAGWQTAGLQGIVASIIDPLPRTLTAFAAVGLLTAALGPWLPEKVGIGLVSVVERLRRRRAHREPDETGSFWMLQAVQRPDAALLWLSLAILASMAGVVALLTMVASGVAAETYLGVLEGFFWVDTSLTAFQWGALAAYTAPLWITNGLVVTTLWPVVAGGHHPHRTPAGVAAGVLVGVGVAWITAEILADRGTASGQIFMMGVMPMFVLAACAAWISQRCDRAPADDGQRAWDPPEQTGRTERLIWMALVVWATACALIGAGWLACLAPSGLWSSGVSGWGRFLLFVAGGLALGTLLARGRSQSASGCGMALWAAGLGTGIGATCLSYWSDQWAAVLAEACCVTVPVGFALYYTERGWLARVGSETLGFAQLASGVLVGLALGLIASFWMTIPVLGPMGTVTLGALILLAFGGLVQIYEQDRAPRIRRFRLLLVFVSMIGAILVFPSDARRWTSRAQRAVVPSVPVAPPVPGGLAIARRVCLIGVDASMARAWSSERARTDVLSLANQRRRAGLTPADRAAPGAPAFRVMPLQREGYDFIYQLGCGEGAADRFSACTSEWFTLLRQHAAPAGRIVLDVPLETVPRREAVIVIAATFERAMESRAWYASVDAPGANLLRLSAQPGGAPTPPSDGTLRWDRVSGLQGSASPPRPHSLRRDTITSILNAPGK